MSNGRHNLRKQQLLGLTVRLVDPNPDSISQRGRGSPMQPTPFDQPFADADSLPTSMLDTTQRAFKSI